VAAVSANPVILLGSVFVVAACGLVYELVAGAVSSYIMGNAVTQFSLVIGVFLSAMGVGSFLSKYIRRHLLKTFIEIEIWIGLIGGGSSMAMFAASAYADPLFPVFFYSLCALIGVLIGIEIPLLIRILRERHGFTGALSHVLALDYLGALLGSVLFPLVVLPFLGLSRASVVFGIMNLAVAAAGLTLLERPRKWIMVRLVGAALILVAAFFTSERLVGFLEDLLYEDSIVFARTTPYQRIVLTRWRGDIRLYLNGHLQFCSLDEARYHEALVIPAMEAAPRPRQVLILGGGDGLAAREVLKYQSVRAVRLVDLDPAVTDLAQTRTELVSLNRGSLSDPRVEIINRDAMLYLQDSRDFFDVILVDLPDPNTEALSKLYSRSFYALCARRLRPGGVLVTQATSPFFARSAFWCIVQTVESAGGGDGLPALRPLPYHVNVPSFGEWGFVLAGDRAVDPLTLRPSVTTRFLTPDTLKGMFSFGRDMMPVAGLETNRLDRPVLNGYYRKGWAEFNE
jgi:spermidine synthase